MEDLLYSSLLCFMLLASHGFALPEDSDEGTDSDDYDSYDNEPEITTPTTRPTKAPCEKVLHVKGPTSMVPVGCKNDCEGIYYTVQNNVSCYDMNVTTAQGMKRHVEYQCPLGVCMSGVCIRKNRTETCVRVGTLGNRE
ncbi:uncharacterized protein LOC144118987 [Amblyomma americanum]